MNIGIIGLGQAGNMVANEVFQKGIPAIACNYSQRDLDSAKEIPLKLKLYGSEGVGKDREEAKKLMSSNIESTVDFIKQHFNKPSIEIIFVVFSTGGGSGSGIGPLLLEVLTQEMNEKVFVAVPIMPDQEEVVVNQINCFNCFSELQELDLCVLPIDNNKTKVYVSGKNELYKKVNVEFAELLIKLFSYTNIDSFNGNIDNKDLLNLFKTPGIANISEVNLIEISKESFNLSPFSVARAIQSSWDKGIFSPIEHKQIIKAAVIFDGQENLMSCIDHKKVFENFNNAPIDIFEGNYHKQLGEVITVLTGLSWPEKRLEVIEGIVESKKHTISSVLGNQNKGNKSKINLTDFAPKKTETKKRMSLDDIVKKYQ